MSKNRNFLPGDFSWVHELAKNELNPDTHSVFNSLSQLDPRQVIEESTVEFLEELRDLFTAYVKVFNSYSESSAKFSEIKIYGIANTAADFMLFRNNVKLVFANAAHGIINCAFVQHVRGDLAVDGSAIQKQPEVNQSQKSHDISAQIGPFFDIKWIYHGEAVTPDRVVKYFLIEFIKASRTVKKDSTNQLLLKQIKALLQDQGIDL